MPANPTYSRRMLTIFERQGLFNAHSTTCDWMAACAELLWPLYDVMVTAVLQSAWLHTDDTPVKNLGHQPRTKATARFWIYLGGRAHPYNVFDFTVNRKRDGPRRTQPSPPRPALFPDVWASPSTAELIARAPEAGPPCGCLGHDAVGRTDTLKQLCTHRCR
jgi:hypothetical protein